MRIAQLLKRIDDFPDVDTEDISWRLDAWGYKELCATQQFLEYIIERDSELRPDGYARDALRLAGKVRQAAIEVTP
ncbi:MAG: hypothetical protein HONBIEJF_02534 [Fimbriimonadaceae bacterium]|nr:hypothetical protein [Fimbriimonadaceae bacterium]